MSDQNDLMSIVGLLILGIILLYVGTLMDNMFAIAFIIPGVIGIAAALFQGYRLFAG
jgi:hypothetical protein